MSDSPLRQQSKAFAKQIVILCREIKVTHKEAVLTNQLLRSGTSIGANLHEAQYAQGAKDFISKEVRKSYYDSGFYCMERREDDTIERTLVKIEKHFQFVS